MKERSLQYYKDLIIVLTQKELKVKYKRNFLGYLWSIANPLALALVFFIAFKIVMRIPIENYTLFLITGLFPWQWFSNSVNGSPMVFVGNVSLIKKVKFRREVLVIATVLNDMLHFIFSIPVIVVFLFIYGMKPDPMWLLGIPILLILEFIIVFGFSIAISSINLFFRDIERLVFILTTLMFYFTPIIYSEDMIPEEIRNLILLNPLSIIMISWRNLFIRGTINFYDIIICFIYSVTIAIIGYLIFKKLSWKFAEVI